MLYFGVIILLKFPKFSVTRNPRAKSLLMADMHAQLQKHLVQLLSELQKNTEALCSVLQRHLLAFTRQRMQTDCHRSSLTLNKCSITQHHLFQRVTEVLSQYCSMAMCIPKSDRRNHLYCCLIAKITGTLKMQTSNLHKLH